VMWYCARVPKKGRQKVKKEKERRKFWIPPQYEIPIREILWTISKYKVKI
jgi:hypothetical protein